MGLTGARASSHQTGVVGIRDKVEVEGGACGGEGRRRVSELEEETATKCVLRVLAIMEDEFVQKKTSCQKW